MIATLGGNDRVKSSGALVCTGRGDDRVIARGPGQRIYGGSGNDRITFTYGNQFAAGGPGNDVIHSSDEGNDRLQGNAGADEVAGARGSDQLFGGAGPDLLLGGGGADMIWGGPGNDVLRGATGTDRLHGGSGHDRQRSGPDGPPIILYQGNKRGFRVRLRVLGDRIAGVHLSARQRCKDGSFAFTGYDDNHASIPIRGGKFREHSFTDYEYGTFEDELAGRVTPQAITGHFYAIDVENFVKCVTGRFGHISVRFAARRLR